MLGLDATHQVRADAERGSRAIRRDRHGAGARCGRDLLRLLHDARAANRRDGARRAAARSLHASPGCWRRTSSNGALRIDVETASPLTLGHTAVEFRAVPGRSDDDPLGDAADADGVFALLDDAAGDGLSMRLHITSSAR